ncbi:B3 domain-containing protein REM16-like, partial [Carica papaya]|uniref:B3 domain-containing protein REM16-like n=1 Tax=Carica papaya TaxID=3649 RepID=UPI000B8CB177
MGETSEQCRQWENIYWSHFQCKQFAQFLLGDFRQQLEIPKRFSQYMKEKLPESIVLRGPSGITWNVELTSKDDALFFQDGWQEFVKDHSLKENDVLIFRYHERSHFDVFMFDGQNLCEKEVSYFINKSANEKPEDKSPRKSEEHCVEANHTPTHCATDCTSFDNFTTGDGEMMPVKSESYGKRKRTEARSTKAAPKTRFQQKRGLPNPEVEMELEPGKQIP